MRKADPRVKLEFILLVTAAALILRSLPVLGVLAAAVAVLTMLYGGDLPGFFRRFKGFAAVLLGVAVLQLVFVRTGGAVLTLGGVTLIYSNGLLAAISAAVRFFVVLCASCVMAGEDMRRVTQALIQMKFPYVFVFMLSVALRFIPFFAQAFSQAMEAVQLRGVEFRRVPAAKRIRLFSYLLLPVTAEAIIRAQDISVSMEARGFGAYKQRGSLVTLKLSATDIALLLLQASAFFLAVIFFA